MDRKMRAKANNAAARKARERSDCPQAGKLMPQGSTVCDQCGDELLRVPIELIIELLAPDDERELH